MYDIIRQFKNRVWGYLCVCEYLQIQKTKHNKYVTFSKKTSPLTFGSWPTGESGKTAHRPHERKLVVCSSLDSACRRGLFGCWIVPGWIVPGTFHVVPFLCFWSGSIRFFLSSYYEWGCALPFDYVRSVAFDVKVSYHFLL